MKNLLYPELTLEEYDTVIRPIEETIVRASASTPIVVDPIDRPLATFGVDSEQYSFESVGNAIASHMWQKNWTGGLDHQLQNVDRFRRQALAQLGESVVTLAIRPLVEAMPSSDAKAAQMVYQTFCRDLMLDGFKGLFELYPVLSERINTSLVNQIAAYSETLQRIHEDRPTLRQLGIDPRPSVSAITPAGDTHHQGRSVSIIDFQDGTKLIYKPRSVDSEAGYSHLCAELNSRFGTTFLSARVIARASYGYVEYVTTTAPETDSMRSTGELLALLYVLNARDMHYSNIVTTRRGPVPVDLETLLHPHRHKASGTSESPLSAYRLLDRSVYGTGVLPLIITSPGRDGFLDAGYVGGGEQKGDTPFRQFRVTNAFRSDMKVIWAPDASISPGAMLTQSSQGAERIQRSCEEVIDGFTSAYRQFSGAKEWMGTSIDKAFSGATLRYIHNATIQYTHLLRMLTGSDASHSEELARGLVRRIGIASRGADVRLVRSECDQLWEGDVPYFSIDADDHILHSGHGSNPVGEVDFSPLRDVRLKLQALSEKDMVRETDLIRIAFYAKLPDPHDSMLANQIRLASPAIHYANSGKEHGKLQDLGVRLGLQLRDEMVDDHFPHLPKTWVGPVASGDPDRPWPPGVLGYDLYTGRVGTALSLLAVGRAVEDDTLMETATAVFEPIARILRTDSYEMRSIARAGIGAYSGFAGTLWSLATAGQIAGKKDWVASARQGSELLGAVPLNDQYFDLLSGGVGAELVAGSITPSARMSVTEQCAFALEHNVVERMEYSGLAHGVAGVLMFAARGYSRTGSVDARNLALAAVNEINTAFRRPGGLVRTNRTGLERSSDSWCNGAAGMLLSFHQAANAGLLGRDDVTQMTKSIGPQVSTSLTICHGVLGLYETARILSTDDDVAAALAERLGGYLSPQHLEARTRDDSSRYNFSRSLMAGRPSLIWHIAHRLNPQLTLHSPAFVAGGATQ
ncbi:MAG: type 2 lantipeptide synthetase LanM [Kineosporiaceae bacterium]|nr:type 2 lantipeptide synthetase LanM [Aeromicrobium sp.]